MPAVLQRFFSQFAVLPLDPESARIAGRIRAELAALGMPIGPYDSQIAAIAMVNNLILVTHNTGEFSRVNGLLIRIGRKKSELIPNNRFAEHYITSCNISILLDLLL